MWSVTDLVGATIAFVLIGGLFAQFGGILIASACGIAAIITISAEMLRYLKH